MKAGVFPFNPNGIERSRLLRTSARMTASSNAVDQNRSSHPTNFSPHGTVGERTNVIDQNNSDGRLVRGDDSPRSVVPRFTTSHEAIAALDEILKMKKPRHIHESDDDDEDDDADENDATDEDLQGNEIDECDPDYSPSISRVSSIHLDSSKQSNKAKTVRGESLEEKQKRNLHSTQIDGDDSFDENGIDSSPKKHRFCTLLF